MDAAALRLEGLHLAEEPTRLAASETSAAPGLADLPPEVLHLIAVLLGRRERLRLAATCRRLLGISGYLWDGAAIDASDLWAPQALESLECWLAARRPAAAALRCAPLLDGACACFVDDFEPGLALPLPPLLHLVDLELVRQSVGARELTLIFQHTQLTRLVLEQAGLQRLRPGLSALSRLQQLSVADNEGLAAGFAHLSRLGRLTALDLSRTGMQAIPSALASMPQLRELRLARNRLSGGWQYLAGLGRLSLLAVPGWRSLEDHAMPVQLPEVLARLTGLRSLDCSSTMSVRSGWQHLPTALTHLDIYGTGWLQHLPPAIGRMPHLASLELGFWRQLEAGAGALACMPPTLTHLVLRDCNLTALPPDLARLTGPLSLSLSGNPHADGAILGAGWEHLPAGRLTYLSLRGCKLLSLPTQLARCTALLCLDLGRCSLQRQAGWEALAALARLTRLDIGNMGLAALPAALSCLPSLADLDASHNPGLASAGFWRLLAGAAGGWAHLAGLPLTRLDLGACELAQLPPPIGTLTALRSLSLAGSNIRATDGFQALSPLRHLTFLEMIGCLTLPPALSHLCELEKLNVNCSPELAASDSWLCLRRLPNLRAVFALQCGLQSRPCGLPPCTILFGVGT